MVLGGCMVLGDALSWGLHGPRVDDLSGPGGGGACSQGCVVCLFRGVWWRGWCVTSWGGMVVTQHGLRQNLPCEQNDKQV